MDTYTLGRTYTHIIIKPVDRWWGNDNYKGILKTEEKRINIVNTDGGMINLHTKPHKLLLYEVQCTLIFFS